jgi:hypothetical protein
MDPNEPRTLWILIDPTGTPADFSWAVCKDLTETGAYPAKSPSWHAALMTINEQAADGWDAISTNWKRIPKVLQKSFFDNSPTKPEIVGREIRFAGMAWSLDDVGCVDPSHSVNSPRNPCCPDVRIDDEDAAATMIFTVYETIKVQGLADLNAKADAAGLTQGQRDAIIGMALMQLKPLEVSLVEKGTQANFRLSSDPNAEIRLGESFLLRKATGMPTRVSST